MRIPRAVAATLAPLALGIGLGACGGGDQGLNAAEQRYADAFARDLADGDDGLTFDDEGGRCVGEAIMRELGTRPFLEAKVQPDDLAGDETPGQLLGSGKVSEAQAEVIAAKWNHCVDLPKAFAKQAATQFGLDRAGISCFEGQLRKSKVLDQYLVVSFTSDEGSDLQSVLDQLVRLVQTCSATKGAGGVLVDSIAASLAQTRGLEVDQARCIAQHVVDQVGADQLVGLGKGGSLAAAPQEVQEQVAGAIIDAARACGVDLSKVGSG
jgi:hypothetical protein